MPKVDRWARLTVRLPAETYHRLEALAEEIPGMTPNALIRLAVEQLTPQLETMADALKAARTGQRSNALELLVALAQAAGNQMPVSVETGDRPAPEARDRPAPRDAQTTLAHVYALQREQGHQVRQVLDEPQGRALRQALERIQGLQQEQMLRLQEAVEQPDEKLQAMLEWVRALQEEQARWLHDVLAQEHPQPLRQGLERVLALLDEQQTYVQEVVDQLRAGQQRDTERTDRQERFDAAVASHERWLTGGGRERGGPGPGAPTDPKDTPTGVTAAMAGGGEGQEQGGAR